MSCWGENAKNKANGKAPFCEGDNKSKGNVPLYGLSHFYFNSSCLSLVFLQINYCISPFQAYGPSQVIITTALVLGKCGGDFKALWCWKLLENRKGLLICKLSSHCEPIWLNTLIQAPDLVPLWMFSSLSLSLSRMLALTLSPHLFLLFLLDLFPLYPPFVVSFFLSFFWVLLSVL